MLNLNSDEINNINVTHVLNIKHRNATKDLIDECKPEKYANYKLEVLVVEKVQQDDVNIKRIFDLAEAGKIDGYVARVYLLRR
jgi:signal transduction histidine kinase